MRRRGPFHVCRECEAERCAICVSRCIGCPVALIVACGSPPAPQRPDTTTTQRERAVCRQREVQPTRSRRRSPAKAGRSSSSPASAVPASVWDETVAHLGGHVEAHVLTLAGFAGAARQAAARRDRAQGARALHPRAQARQADHRRPQHGRVHRVLARRDRARSDRRRGRRRCRPGARRTTPQIPRPRSLLRNMWAQAGDDELPDQVRTAHTRHGHRSEGDRAVLDSDHEVGSPDDGRRDLRAGDDRSARSDRGDPRAVVARARRRRLPADVSHDGQAHAGRRDRRDREDQALRDARRPHGVRRAARSVLEGSPAE